MKYTNEELVEKYTKRLGSRRLSDKTINTYLNNINPFIKSLDISLLDVKRSDILDYIDTLSGNASASVYSKISAISSLYDYITYDLELLEKSPTYKIERPKIKNKEKKALTDIQADSLIENAKNIRDKSIVYLMLTTGIRVSECITLKLSQFRNRDKNNGILITGKGDKDRRIYLNDKCVQYINEYINVKRKSNELDELFLSNQNTKMDRCSMSRTLKVIAKRSGEFTEEEITNLCNHELRCTSATKMGDSGIPVHVIQKILGHADIKTTMIYCKTNENRIIDAMSSSIY